MIRISKPITPIPWSSKAGMSNPGISKDIKYKAAVFANKLNKPKVNRLTGSDTILKKGFMNKQKNEKAADE